MLLLSYPTVCWYWWKYSGNRSIGGIKELLCYPLHISPPSLTATGFQPTIRHFYCRSASRLYIHLIRGNNLSHFYFHLFGGTNWLPVNPPLQNQGVFQSWDAQCRDRVCSRYEILTNILSHFYFYSLSLSLFVNAQDKVVKQKNTIEIGK